MHGENLKLKYFHGFLLKVFVFGLHTNLSWLLLVVIYEGTFFQLIIEWLSFCCISSLEK